MIPVMEFVERLESSDKQSVLKFRSCDNELEAKNYGILKDQIQQTYDEQDISTTYLAQMQQV